MTLSRRKKFAFATFTLVAFFLVLESGLHFLGIPETRITEDPYVGFSDLMPLMQSSTGDSGETIMSTSPDKLRLFNQQSFLDPKPAGTRRVFCVGGSTTYGRPFDDSTSYSAYLRELLPIADPSVRWEVINAGGVSYASYRVAKVMEEMSRFQPDLFIVYSAHNEFLERRTYASMYQSPRWQQVGETWLRKTRTFATIQSLVEPLRSERDTPIEMLPGEVDERLNHTIGPSDYVRDEQWQSDVMQHYRVNLLRMIQIARDCGAAIVFVEPSCNEKDCSPFKNEDDYFSLGKDLFANGQFDEAREAFSMAIDRDVCPLRATSTISNLIRSVSQQNDVPVVPFDTRLRETCLLEFGHPCLGEEYFLDHVHPTIDVHRQLALWIIEALRASDLVGGSMPVRSAIESVDAKIRAGIVIGDQGVAFRNLAKVLHWSGKFIEAQRPAENALRLLPGDPESQFVLADCLAQSGKPAEALARYETLMLTIDYEKAMLPYAYLLADQGKLKSAKAYAAMATASDKPTTRKAALELLAEIHEALGEKALAEEVIRQSP